MASQRQLAFDPVEEARRQWREHGWGEAADGMAAVTSIMRAQQVLLARVDEVLRPLGLTFSRYETLRLLAFSRSGRLPLGKMGDRLQVHAASVTNAVARLEAERQVRRLPNPSDGRGVLAEITETGREVVELATAELNAKVFTAVGFTDRQCTELISLLRTLRRAAGDF
ncbi:MAG: MarR family winged helix-turn-helix transcriptional regulator [Acidimicrobiales bacterium]